MAHNPKILVIFVVMKWYLVPILLLALTDFTLSQYPYVQVNNISLERNGNFILISYDLDCADSTARFDVDIYFVDDRYNTYAADVLTGDVGEGVSPGKGKLIRWNLIEEYGSFTGVIRPVILVNKDYVNHPLGGPKYALLSVLMPGLGDMYTNDPDEMVFKPALRGASTYGLLLMGYIASVRRYTTGTYLPKRIESVEGGRPRWKPAEWIDKEVHYWMFRGDKEVFFSLAALIWAADIFQVIGKGGQNQKMKRTVDDAVKFYFGYTGSGPGAGLVLRF